MKKIILALLVINICACEKSAPYLVSDFTDSVFTAGIEGPMTYRDGNIYVVNFQQEGTIGCVKPNGSAELFVTLPKGSVGNGIRFTEDGVMLIADYTSHSVLAVDMNTKKISVYAHDSTMNQPNDLTILKNGVLFCSDPNWVSGTGKLWRIGTNKSPTLVMDSLGTTNGIEVSPDQKYLYVNESVQRKIWRYELNNKAEVVNKTLLISFDDGGLDGMKCDSLGNIWVARYDKGSVLKISPDGFVQKEIILKGTKPTNLTFSLDGKTVYVTMQDRGKLEKFEIE